MHRRLDGDARIAEVPALPALERTMHRRLDEDARIAEVPALPALERTT
jgi:hypothetical protein